MSILYPVLVGDCKHKGKDVCVFRDASGKWFIKVDGITTQNGLNASEMVRWCLNAMHEDEE